MAILKAEEVRAMSREERTSRLTELRDDLMHERGVAAMGGSPPSPGKIRQLRTAIARIHTINRLEELGKLKFTEQEEATGAAGRATRRAAAEKAKQSESSPKKTAKKTTAKKTTAKKTTKDAPKKASSSTKKTTKPKKKTTKKTTKKSGGTTGGNE